MNIQARQTTQSPWMLAVIVVVFSASTLLGNNFVVGPYPSNDTEDV